MLHPASRLSRARKLTTRAALLTSCGVAISAFLLTGCTPASTSSSTSSGSIVESAAVTTPVPISTEPGQDQATISTDAVPGLNPESASQADLHIFYRWFSLAGHSELGDAQKAVIQQWIDGYTNDHEPVFDSGVAKPELNIQPVLTAATQDVIGVRLESYEFLGASGATSFQTLWYFLKDHKALTARALFKDDEARERMIELAKTELLKDPDAFTEEAEQIDGTYLKSLNFDSAGNGLVEFDEYAVAPGAAGPQVITIPAKDLLPLLNKQGEAAREAGMSAQTNGATVPSNVQTTAANPSTGASSAQTTAPSTITAPPTAPAAPSSNSVDCAVTKCIALTFDDGPGPYTQRLLDTLEQYKAKATFFVVGANVGRYKETLMREAANGHEIGNHTWSHRSLPTLSDEGVSQELESTSDAIANVLGYAPNLVRPPYGATNSRVNQLAHNPVILWDVDTVDWKSLSSDAVVKEATASAHPGAIVLMHDIHSSTVDAVPEILKRLRAEGYQFVTVSQLLSSKSPAAGVVYSSGPASAK